MKKWISIAAGLCVLLLAASAEAVSAATYQTRANWSVGGTYAPGMGNLAFWDESLDNDWPVTSMWTNCPILAILQDPMIGTIDMNDWLKFTAAEWTVTETGAGGTVIIDDNGIGGILLITTDANDNDSEEMQEETSGAVNDANWSLTAGRPLWFEIKFAVAKATESDIIVGLCEPDDTTVIDGLADGGVYFRKDDGDANIDIVTEEATTKTAADSGVDLEDDTFIRCGFYYDGATAGTVTFYINGVAVGTSATNLPNHTLCVTICYQNGEAGATTMMVDYHKVVQLR